jgi:hypothetical protein
MVLKKGTINSVWALDVAEKARNSAAPRPSSDCQKYFQPAERPFGSRYTTFFQSSYQPTKPKPRVTTSTVHTYLLLKSPHSSVVTPIEIRISTPPIVGVPDLTK